MATNYFGSGSGGGTSYFGATPVKINWQPPRPPRRPPKDEGFSVGGLLGNLLGDVRDTALGLFPGMWEFAKHPIRGVEQIGEYYKATYGPLFSGDFSSFARNIYEHPLGPALDAATLATAPFTAGASVAARGGSLLGKAGLISGETAARLGGLTARNVRVFRSPGLQGAGGIGDPVAFGKQIRAGNILPENIPQGLVALPGARGPTQRVVQRSFDRITNRLDQLLPDQYNIEAYRFGRSDARKISIDVAQNTAQAHRWQRAYAKLSTPTERAAYTFVARGISPEDYRTVLRQDKDGEVSGAVEPGIRKLIESPKSFGKIAQLYRAPSKDILNAVEEGRRIGQLDAAIKLRHETDPIKRALLRTEMEEAPWRNLQLASGARYVSQPEINKRLREVDSELKTAGTKLGQKERAISSLERIVTPSSPGGRKNVRAAETELRAARQETQTLGKQQEAARKRKEQLSSETALLEDLQKALDIEKGNLERIAKGEVETNDYSRLNIRIPQQRSLRDVHTRLLGRQFNLTQNLTRRVERAAYSRLGHIQEQHRDLDLNERVVANEQRVRDAGVQVESQRGRNTAIVGKMVQEIRNERKGLLNKERETLENLQVVRGLVQSAREQIAEQVPGFYGGKSIAQLKREQRESGVPNPIYLPDHMVPRNVSLARMGAGAGPQQWKNYVNKKLAMQFGRVSLNTDTLGPEFLNTVKKNMATDIHRVLVASARKIEAGTALPKGFVYVRRGRQEKIPYNEKSRGDFEAGLAELFEGDELGAFGTRAPGEAVVQGAGRLIVQERLVKQMAGEFHKSSKFVRNVIEKPTTIFRALVLGLRPAFLVNNLVGNHFLYAISFGGYYGLRGYADSIRREHGDSFARSMLDHKGAPWYARPMYQSLMEEFFPDQIHGTFGETQSPKWLLTKNPKAKRSYQILRKAGLGVLPLTQATAEGALRRAGVITELRKSPEVRKFVKDMPKQSRNFEVGARAALESNPMLARSIADSVNRALGDYFGLSPVERHYVRAAFPFYAWYRAITMITLRLPADHPIRAEILVNLGALGIEETRERMGYLPSFLLGAIGMDPEDYDAIPLVSSEAGRVPILNTFPLNPFATIPELAEAGMALLAGDPGDIAKQVVPMMGPVPQGVFTQASGRRPLTGQQLEPGMIPGLLGALEQGFGSIPQAVIPEAYLREDAGTSKKLFDQDPDRLLLNWAGLPIKQVRPGTAEFMKKLEEGLLKQISLIVPNK